MAESIDFQFPMKKACGSAIQKFCSDVPHNHARVIRCLQDKLGEAGMPAECKKEVEGHTAHASQDYRYCTLACTRHRLLYHPVPRGPVDAALRTLPYDCQSQSDPPL